MNNIVDDDCDDDDRQTLIDRDIAHCAIIYALTRRLATPNTKLTIDPRELPIGQFTLLYRTTDDDAIELTVVDDAVVLN